MKMTKQQVVEEIYLQKNKQVVVEEEVVPAATWALSPDDEFSRCPGSPFADLFLSSLWSSADFSAGPSTGTTEPPPVLGEAPTWEQNSPSTGPPQFPVEAPIGELNYPSMAATRDVSPCPDLPFSSGWNSADYSAGPSTGTTGPPPVRVEPPTRFLRRIINLPPTFNLNLKLDKIKLKITSTGDKTLGYAKVPGQYSFKFSVDNLHPETYDFSTLKEIQLCEFDFVFEVEDVLLNKIKDFSLKSKFSLDVDEVCQEELEIVNGRMKLQNLLMRAISFSAIIGDIQLTCRYVMGRYVMERIDLFVHRKTQICNGRPEITFREGLQEEILQTIKSFPNNEPDLSHEFVQISQNTRSSQGPQAYPKGADIQIGSSEQQPTVDFDVTCNGGNIVITDQSDIPVTGSEKSNIKMISPLLSPEFLPQLYGMKLDDAAKCLGVSRSTLKRVCRKHRIWKWPFHKGKTVHNRAVGSMCWPAELRGSNLQNLCPTFQQTDSIPSAPYCVPNNPVSMQPRTLAGQMPLEQMPVELLGCSLFLMVLHASKEAVVLESTETVPPCSELPPEHGASSIAHTLLHVAAMQDMKTFNIKATHRIGTIQFPLSSSSRKAELEENISERLNLNPGNFRICYMDTEGDWILITCDKDLQYCMIVSERLGHNTIKMLVEDITTM